MRIFSGTIAAVAFLAATSLAATAHAAQATFIDPAGDGAKGDRLDITAATVRNDDRRIVVTTSYVRVARGDLIVFLKARGIPGGLRVVSEHRPAGEDRTYLLDRRGDEQECGGLRVTWDALEDTSRVRLPSACFHDGDYGAVRIALLTEIGAADVDIAPDADAGNGLGWSRWVARG